jgi:hypothetical protein
MRRMFAPVLARCRRSLSVTLELAQQLKEWPNPEKVFVSHHDNSACPGIRAVAKVAKKNRFSG